MTTYDPDTQEQDRSVLQRIVDEYGGRFALDCYVIQEGAVREGDPVEIAGYWTLSTGRSLAADRRRAARVDPAERRRRGGRRAARLRHRAGHAFGMRKLRSNSQTTWSRWLSPRVVTPTIP